MKKSTKIFSAAFALAACCASALVIAPKASAAETITGTLSDAVGKQGEEVEITFSLLDNPGTALCEVSLEYDKAVFEVAATVVEGEDPVAKIRDYGVYPQFYLPNPAADTLKLTAGDPLSTTNIIDVGDLYAVTFKIKEDAVPGTYEIKATGDFYDVDLNSYSLSMIKNSTVTVECAHKNTKEEVVEATCTTEGSRTVICESCGETVISETIAKIPHTPGDWQEVTPATCTTEGSRVQRCTVCSGEIATEVIPALGHDYGEGTVTKEPDCTTAGEIIYECTRCHETKTEELAALGHKPEWITVKEPTETEEGLRQKVCTVCNTVLEEAVVPVNGIYVEEELRTEIADMVKNAIAKLNESLKEVQIKSDSVIFNVVMLVNGEEISETEEMQTVTFDIPEKFKDSNPANLTVLRLEEDGTVTEVDMKVAEGKISFETNRFGVYVVAEKAAVEPESETTTEPESETETEAQTPTEKTTGDSETPKTGDAAPVAVFGIVAIVACAGVLVSRRKFMMK